MKNNDVNNIQIKVELWKEINSYINKIEEKYSFFFTILVTFFGGLIVFCEGDLVPEKLFDFKFFVLLFLPIAISVIMAYLAYNFRLVAIARMYATALEKAINKDLGEKTFAWNSNIVDEFFAKRNFVNTKLLPIVNAMLFLFMSGFLIYAMYCSPLNLWIKRFYGIALFALLLACVLPFIGNEKIRKSEYKLDDELLE